MGRLIAYIVATSYLRRGRRDVKLSGQDILRIFLSSGRPKYLLENLYKFQKSSFVV